jgi:DNA segregation ATPase FtsK/SpoIIIE-like protein
VKIDEEALHASSRILESKLADFGVEGEVVAVRPGPVITPTNSSRAGREGQPRYFTGR